MADESIDPRRVAVSLGSASPEEVAGALAMLDRQSLRRPPIPVRAPDVSVLQVFGDRPPEQVVTDLVAVLLGYPLFDPPLDDADRLAAALEAALPYGSGQPAYEVAKFVRSRPRPTDAVEEMMRAALDADPEDLATLDALGQIVDMLLDAKSTHQATVRGLEGWAFRGRYPEVIAEVSKALTDAERDRLRASGDS